MCATYFRQKLYLTNQHLIYADGYEFYKKRMSCSTELNI